MFATGNTLGTQSELAIAMQSAARLLSQALDSSADAAVSLRQQHVEVYESGKEVYEIGRNAHFVYT